MFSRLSRLILLTIITASWLGVASSQPKSNICPVGNLVWQGLGQNENDAMPFGNGDIAVNAWTEKNGDIVLLLGKADAWAEDASLLKLGRVRISITPNPFTDTTGITQILFFQNSTVEIKKGNNTIKLWADANHPVVHVQANLVKKGRIVAVFDPWRKIEFANKINLQASKEIMSGDKPAKLKPDILFSAHNNRIAWCHFNVDSYYPYTLKQQHLGSLIGQFSDPLYHRCFGAMITGQGMISRDDRTVVSEQPINSQRLDIIALTDTAANSPDSWLKEITQLTNRIETMKIADMALAHDNWWRNFWNRSYIKISGTDDARKVSDGYAIQRYMMAASSRGEMPVKFNGGLFTVGRNVPEGVKQTNEAHDPDYRRWGECYWNQNNRLLYWPLIATGDTDLLRPWFNMYTKRLAFAIARNKIYYQHEGASYPETMYFWGLPRMSDFGKNNPTNEIQSHWQKYHIQGTLEVISQLLDQYDYYGNKDYLQYTVIPFADAIVTYYDQHWKRDANGYIYISPSQSLETYQLNAVNPTPDIAGLKSILPRLLALPQDMTTRQQRTRWQKVLHDLPEIPVGKTSKGKIPVPVDEPGDPNGELVLLPAEKYGKRGNSENPELYTVFPYRLYGVGKPGLDLARRTYFARRAPQYTCWGQDGTQSSILGLTSEAKKAAITEFTNYGNQHFKWFWASAHDYIPDLDNGGDGMITLQNMLMQCDGKRIQLTPAWPKDWTADFKLYAPYNTIIEGHIEKGKISHLKITPASRAKDMVVLHSRN